MSSSELAYHGVKADILNHVYKPGERIKEIIVSEKYGVSRTPLREAFGRLIAEGWLETIPNQGVRVAQWSARDLENIFNIRVLLEPYLTGCAVANLRSAQIEALRRYADEIARHVNTTGEEAIEQRTRANNQFHKTLLEASGNPQAVAILNNLVQLPLVIWTFRQFSSQETARSNAHHYEIAEAAAAGDAQWASSVMKSHILAARNTVLARMQPQPDQPEA